MERLVSNQLRYLQAWNAAFNDGEPGAFDSIRASDYVRHYSQAPGYISLDSGGFKSAVLEMRRGFPDIKSKIDDVFGGDNEFMIRWSSDGTHLNSFLGIPATGKHIVTDGVTVCRFKDGLLQEEWVAWNLQGVASALGFRDLRRGAVAPDVEAHVDEKLLRKAHSKFVTGVTVVAGLSDDSSPFGLAVNAFMSVSLDPPTVVVCINKTSRSHDLFVRSGAFAVNILAAHQIDVAKKFASSAADKFNGVAWRRGILGVPLIEKCSAAFEAQTTEFLRAGTHTLLIGHVAAVESTDEPPLVYMGSQFLDLGASRRVV
jgi:steroid delta-isomerase-like uncharacterized protein